jgi:AraC-like DNA-binding protein
MNRKLIALTAAVAALALPAASLAHSATSGSSSTTAAASANRPHHHPTFAAIAKELGVDVATVKAAFKANRPAEGQRPTAAQREAVAAALGTTAAKLDAIMKEHAPQRGPKAPIAQIAKELGLSETAVKAAFEANRPAPGTKPTDANKNGLAASLGITRAQLDALMDEYRHAGPPAAGAATAQSGSSTSAS